MKVIKPVQYLNLYGMGKNPRLGILERIRLSIGRILFGRDYYGDRR